ncbi:hypothetical protein UC34_13995 [Pandoraea vervacti]|uniref:Uncharacterized protein n=1 Tax=Pandoraea vervacti TaxID=656178 RepID=A0ABM5SZ65_9BURK|nr:hypothetical protein [Pandoraea vervacti]AJP57792.1 hypothetical protein UC34_13995 [Pandoraea vervacti]
MIPGISGSRIGATTGVASDVAPGERLTSALAEFEVEVQRSAPGSAQLTRLVDWLEMEVLHPENWRCLRPSFKDCAARRWIAEHLARAHLATFAAGVEHLQDSAFSAQLGTLAPCLLGALTQDARDDIVRRWSTGDAAALQVTDKQYFAMDIPGTGFRCALIGNVFGPGGLCLTQREATDLLLARLGDGATTVLQALRRVAGRNPVTAGQLLHAAIGADGSLLPELDAAEVRTLVASILETLRPEARSVVFREPFARYFNWLRDDASAAALRKEMAQILADQAGDLVPQAVRVRDGNIMAPDDIRVQHSYKVGIQHSLAALHFREANAPMEAAIQYVSAGIRLSEGGDAAIADELMMRGEAQLLSVLGAARYQDIGDIVSQLLDACRADYAAIARISRFCATVFESQGRMLSAARVHDAVIACLPGTLESGVDGNARAMESARAFHVRQVQRHYESAGLGQALGDVSTLIRSIVHARVQTLMPVERLAGPNYVVNLDAAQKMFLNEPFDSQWLLLSVNRDDAHETTYHVVSESGKREMLAQATVHPYRERLLDASDFIDGTQALELLLSARPVVASVLSSAGSLAPSQIERAG